MINNHSDYFHVLRYNKAAHDITVERRAKPGGAILSFTPLKLDSVNANWFNYEKLAYSFWEEDHRVVFVFEKMLNTKSTIYMKVIDTLGKSSGFIEVSSTEVEPGVQLSYTFSRGAANTLLAVSASQLPNGVIKKSAVLYDIRKHAVVWTKKLPHENSYKEKTDGFVSNHQHDLMYVHYDFKSTSLIKAGPAEKRIINEFGEIKLAKSAADSKEIIFYLLKLKGIEAVYSATIVPHDNETLFAGYMVKDDFGKKPFLYVEKINEDFSAGIYQHEHPLPYNISEQLTFYDGSDQKDPAYKNYALKNAVCKGNNFYLISERKEENFYKELLVWQVDLKSGLLKKVEVIPRKIFYFDDRTRFKKMGECMITHKNDSLRFYLMEDKANLALPSRDFRYHDFSKQTNLWGANIVAYVSGAPAGSIKRLLYTNRNFDLIPVPYFSSKTNDEVFYFNEGTYEKFGFIFLPNP